MVNLWLSLFGAATAAAPIGVIAFEAAALMSKTAHLHHSLTDARITHLLTETLHLPGIRKLVSDSDTHLLSLAFSETALSLFSITNSLTRLAARCTNPILPLFYVSFVEFVKHGTDPYKLGFGDNVDRKIRRMERMAAATADLYQEMEVLAEIERVERPGAECRRRVSEQRQRVKCLREASLWGKSYDYVVKLLAGAVFAVAARIQEVFGVWHCGVGGGSFSAVLPRSQSLIHPANGSLMTRFASGPLSNGGLRTMFASGPLQRTGARSSRRHKVRWLGSVRPFGECMAGGNELPVVDSYVHTNDLRQSSAGFGVVDDDEDGGLILNLALYLDDSKRKLLSAWPGTLGGAALALHYANVIIVIERFVATPHLIGPDARDDLYYMLTASIRAALRARLKSYAKNLALCVYDPVLASEWTEAVGRILEWLAPLAHNMIKWQSERNFEQQHLVSNTNVLLLQTLYFANQAKTEAAITELLVGLNYMWRFGKELHAKAMCGSFSSRNYDDCLEKGGSVFTSMMPESQ